MMFSPYFTMEKTMQTRNLILQHLTKLSLTLLLALTLWIGARA